MKTFKQYITEEVLYESKKEEDSKNKVLKLDHPEDLMFRAGSRGSRHAIDTLNALHRRLSGQAGNISVKTKHGGQPVVFGTHPETKDFFVGTKSALRKNKSIVHYTDQDIDKSHHPADVKSKLKTVLHHLPMVTPIRGVYEGELIHGEDDKNFDIEDEGLKEKIKRSKIGIMVHSKYDGKKMDDLKREEVDHHHFGSHPSVNLINPNHEISKTTYHPAGKLTFEAYAKKAESLHNKLNGLMPEMPQEHLKTYIDSATKRNKDTDVAGFMSHLKYKFASNKTHLGLKRAYEHINKKKEDYDNMFELHRNIRAGKKVLLQALNSHKGPYSKNDGSYIVHEGGKTPIKMTNRYKEKEQETKE